MSTQTPNEFPFSHLTALLYPQLHFVEYGGTFKIPALPDSPGKLYPFDDREEFLMHWLHLAKQHRQLNSAHSLVPEVLHFYNFHLQKAFADIQYELEGFCKAANKMDFYEKLFCLIDSAFHNLQNHFELDLLTVTNNTEPLCADGIHYDSYEAGRLDIEEKINSFASEFFRQAKESYTDYTNQICHHLDAIGKNASIAYPGETAKDYLRRQTGLREQYKLND